MEKSYHLKAILLPHGNEVKDIWIKNGRVTFIPEEDAEELATTGSYVLLGGLVNCHLHCTLDFLGTGLPSPSEVLHANRKHVLMLGTFLLRDLGSDSHVALNLVDDDPLPEVLACGHLLAPDGGSPLGVQGVPPDRLVEAALRQIEAGAQWVKYMGDWPGGPWMPDWGQDKLNYSFEVVSTMVEAVHQAGGRVAVHAMGPEAAEVGVTAGVDSIEHGWSINEALLRMMAERGTAWTPTLCIAKPLASGAEQIGKLDSSRWIHQKMEEVDSLLQLAVDMGVPILAGTDNQPHLSVAHEIIALHQHGLEPVAALEAASSAAYELLLGSNYGEGSSADMVLYRADPRGNLDVLHKPETMIFRGELISAATA